MKQYICTVCGYIHETEDNFDQKKINEKIIEIINDMA